MRTVRPLQPKVATNTSRVSVGIPVRNGAAYLERALLSVLKQTHHQLEIVISDNASTDDTAQICQDYALMDARIRYARQANTLTANANFRYVWQAAQSDWFLWASHDDLRDTNYVETLLKGFAQHPHAAITFSDLHFFNDHDKYLEQARKSPPSPVVASVGLPLKERRHVLVTNGAWQIYGLFRHAALQDYSWPEVHYAADWLTLLWATSLGESVYVPGSHFYCFVPPRPLSTREFFLYHSLRPGRFENLKFAPDIEWAWTAAHELAPACRAVGETTTPLQLFPELCFVRHGGVKRWAKYFTYWNSPRRARALWEAGKQRWQVLKEDAPSSRPKA